MEVFVRNNVSFQAFVDGVHQGVAFTAQSLEVVHVDGPDHGASVLLLLDEIDLVLHARDVLVTDPLRSLVRVRNFADLVNFLGPIAAWGLQPGADLVVREKSFGLSVFARSSTPSFLVDVSSRRVIVVALAEGEGATVQRDSNDQFLGGTAFLLPELETVVDV